MNGSASTAGLALNLDETAGTDRYAAGDAADNNGGSDETGLVGAAIGTLTSTVTGGLASLFTVSGSAGRDGVAGTQTTAVALQLSDPGANGVPTSLYATGPGVGTQIYLFQNGAVIEGRAGTTSGSPLVFTISLTSSDPATAQVTFTQYLPIEHGNTALYDEAAILNTLGSDAVNLVLTTSLTDGDGDTATTTATYGLVTSTSSPFSIDDDGPTVSASVNGSASTAGLALNLDETAGTDRYAAGDAADNNGGSDEVGLPAGAIGTLTSTVTGGLASLFTVSGSAGRDGVAGTQTTAVALQLSDPGANGVPTSLYATGPGVGTQIYLFQNGTVIEGRAGTTSGSPLVFTISLTSSDPATAQVTFTQYLPIEHGNTALYDEAAILNTLGSDAVNLVLTTSLTDGDGDTATTTATYGLVTSTSSPFSIDDDGPTVSASVNGSASTAGLALNLDETAGTDRYAAGDAADNNGGSDEVGLPAGAIGTLTSTVTGGLASLFTVSGSAGRDGVAGTQTTAVALQLSDPGANGVPTSLYATGPGVGTQIYLFQNGTVIEGRAGTTSGSPLVFTISLTSSDAATAQVTFTQYLPIEHGNTALYDEAAILNTLGSDAVNLVLTTSLTDGDGDTATTTATYGLVTSTSSPFSIDDDGPTVSASVNGSASTAGLALNLDETAGTDRYAAGDAADNNGGSDEVGLPAGAIGTLTSTVTGGLASLFTVSGSAGRDGVAGTQTTAVALQLSDPGANGVPTSLYATGPGVGTQIYLFQNGAVIEGRAGTTSGSPLVFTISLTSSDPATAQVTFTQYLPIEHGNTALYDEAAILNTLGSDAVNLVLTTSLTDGDGDTATTTATYGLVTSTSSPFSIDDDGPVRLSVSDQTLYVPKVAGTTSTDFGLISWEPGRDMSGSSLTFSGGTNGMAGETSAGLPLTVTVAGVKYTVFLTGFGTDTLSGKYGGADLAGSTNTAFVLHLNSDGTYQIDASVAFDSVTKFNYDDFTSAIGGGNGAYFRLGSLTTASNADDIVIVPALRSEATTINTSQGNLAMGNNFFDADNTGDRDGADFRFVQNAAAYPIDPTGGGSRLVNSVAIEISDISGAQGSTTQVMIRAYYYDANNNKVYLTNAQMNLSYLSNDGLTQTEITETPGSFTQNGGTITGEVITGYDTGANALLGQIYVQGTVDFAGVEVWYYSGNAFRIRRDRGRLDIDRSCHGTVHRLWQRRGWRCSDR